MSLPAVPDLTDRETWLQPVSQEEAQRLVILAHHVICDTTAPADSAERLASLLASRYTVGELRYAVRELAFERELEDKRRYSREGEFALRPADFERVISDRHRLIHMLDMKLTAKQRDALILEWPRDLSEDDFACCGYDSYNNPLWKYAPGMQQGRTVAIFPKPNESSTTAH